MRPDRREGSPPAQWPAADEPRGDRAALRAHAHPDLRGRVQRRDGLLEPWSVHRHRDISVHLALGPGSDETHIRTQSLCPPRRCALRSGERRAQSMGTASWRRRSRSGGKSGEGSRRTSLRCQKYLREGVYRRVFVHFLPVLHPCDTNPTVCTLKAIAASDKIHSGRQ